MPDATPSAVLLVRDLADLERAGRDVAAYWRARRRRPLEAADRGLGDVRIDARATAEPPSVLEVSDGQGGRRTLPVVETVGVSGLWVVCWLDEAGAAS